MPSALETLVKILKLEREQGFRNTAVIGGLSAFAQNWRSGAHAQARRPEHHILVDELIDVMSRYDQSEQDEERPDRVHYMLGRITGRIPTPDAYLQRMGQYEAAAPPSPSEGDRAPTPPAPPMRQDASQEEREKRKDKNRAKRESKTEQRPGRVRGASPELRPTRQQAAESEDDDRREAGSERDGEHSRLDDDMVFSSKPSKRDLPPPPRLARPPRRARPFIDVETAQDLLQGLHASVERVKGVGPKQQEMLGRLGIRTINDLLFYFPTRYDDYTQLVSVARLKPSTLATVIGTVRHTEERIGKTGRRDFHMVVDDGTGEIGVTCFGQSYLRRTIQPGQQVVLRGQTSLFRNLIQFTNPEIVPLDLEDLQAAQIVPVYPLTEGLNNRQLRRIVEKALDYWTERIPDYVPEGTLERLNLADLGWALRNIHFPEGPDHLEHAKNRLIFDQLLMLQLTIMANRRQWQSLPALSLTIEDPVLDAVIASMYSYPLTGAQRRSVEDVRRDIARTIPMNRLLQGDVGSGKTAVASTVMAIAYLNGGQAAIMAPTSILAEQHYRGISAAFERLDESIRPEGRRPVIGLLTGSISAGEREAILNGLRDGSIDIVIGTHAIIQEGVTFHNLTLAVIDEQHRFGVEQRGALRGKGTNPHLLVMTATPIPRTLALTLHADLDLSIIDEMPPGRTPVRTRVVEPSQRFKVYDLIDEQIAQGRQAFIVYPLVEASDRVEAGSAVEAYEDIRKLFHHHQVGLLHGRMRPDEKDAIMAAFRDHEFDILVTTSVAEVGVDIPNATVILIEGANRFGLAQLHQFRGRVGRGGHASYCFLLTDSDVPDALERLKALERTNDGFELADIDWKLRGPGNLIGTQQSGRSTLKLVESMNSALVEQAQREARTLYEQDANLIQPEHHLLAMRIKNLQDERSDIS
ncbi:MAG: ATP-dependent DNA helicase RecG [Anaerolineae bacterium]|nr:ATP-dependent DNA helicase RecG [Anaerolineae bacterium]